MLDAEGPRGGWENSGRSGSSDLGASFSPRPRIDNASLDRLRLALAGIDPDSQIAEWWRELRELHEGGGMQARRARDVAYRQARVAELLVQDCTQPEIAERVGCSERTVRGDIEALRRLLEPRVRFEEVKAA
jgi:DNA-binding CsgD family transcriptional regulator